MLLRQPKTHQAERVPMKMSRQGWYVLIVLAALVPVGARVVTWRMSRVPAVDAQMAQAGEVLFKHVWTEKDPLANGGDGLGPVFNAKSCVECHHQGGPGGAGGLKHNVTTFIVDPTAPGGKAREGVVHAFASNSKWQETLAHVDPNLGSVVRPTLEQVVRMEGRTDHCLQFRQGVHVTQRNTPALFGDNLIDAIPDRAIIANERYQRVRWGMSPAGDEQAPVGRVHRLANGKIGRFGWKAQTASLSEFVQAACANELGLGNPFQSQPAPLSQPSYRPAALDLTAEQCDQITSFVASLPKPVETSLTDPLEAAHASAGKRLFSSVGCADCHTPNLGPAEGIYSDLLMHRMSQELQGSGSYNDIPVPDPSKRSDDPLPDEWKTPPLWGIADSAPYMHDGRAPTLEKAIQLHGGQAARSAQRFASLTPPEQAQLIAFLKTLKAP
jgi:CxxC motif-containing protein (DUF1111 family)